MNAFITFIRRYLKPALISQIKELSEHIDDEHQDKPEICELSQELCNEQKQDNPINICVIIIIQDVMLTLLSAIYTRNDLISNLNQFHIQS